jgi:hypothetical protein
MHNPRRMGTIIPIERIASRIYLMRGQKVMLDRDLAELYGVTTGALNQAVKRNRKRFPPDFMFQLSNDETEKWKSHIVISNPAVKMAVRKRPYAFTEHGVAMLSSVLHSDRAIDVNIAIVRAFVKLRQVLASHRELARKIEQHDQQIAVLFDTVQKLLAPPPAPKKRPIGFITPKD